MITHDSNCMWRYDYFYRLCLGTVIYWIVAMHGVISKKLKYYDNMYTTSEHSQKRFVAVIPLKS